MTGSSPASGYTTDVYTIEPDGTGAEQLTNDATNDFTPAWSPNGQRIAWISSRDGNNEVYVMGADGSSPTRVTNDPAVDRDPSWSPDGSEITFASNRDGDMEIYVVGADGSGLTKLTDNEVLDYDPAWSPDGSTIAFSRLAEDENFEVAAYLFTMNADGSGAVRLTGPNDPNPNCAGRVFEDAQANWSPDSMRLAFHRWADDDGFACTQIETMNRDGTGRSRVNWTIADDPFAFSSPAWSPDGTKLAYVQNYDVRIGNPDGTGPTNIGPAFPESVGALDWQPIVNSRPDCSGVAASRTVLTTANRRLVSVTLDGATDPDGDHVSITVDGVFQDEPVESNGDSTSPDAIDEGEGELRIRAERNPRGDGRVYRIAFTATDGRGGSCSGTATVSVPRKKHKPAIDSAPPSYNSLAR